MIASYSNYLNHRKQFGFTLVELLIIIAILGIIASISIPTYRSYIRTSKMKSAESILEQIPLMLETFRAENGAFPGATTTTYEYKENTSGADVSGANKIKGILPEFKARPSTYPANVGILFDYTLTISNPGQTTEAATFTATGVREATGIVVSGSYQ